MTETSLDKVDAPSVNGGGELHAVDQNLTVIAPDDVLSGRLHIKGNGQILGNFSGQIECEGDLLIGGDADVEADLRSQKITISGRVRGNVVAVSRLRITSTGRLEGDARVGALIVQEGGVHHGVIRVHPEGVPEGEDKVIIDPAPEAPVVLRALPNPVGRVKKFWGEFF